MAEVATNYFENIFNSGTCDHMEECLNPVSNRFTPGMQEVLSIEFIFEEIKVMLFQMGPKKAPGPNGMNAFFYQNF